MKSWKSVVNGANFYVTLLSGEFVWRGAMLCTSVQWCAPCFSFVTCGQRWKLDAGETSVHWRSWPAAEDSGSDVEADSCDLRNSQNASKLQERWSSFLPVVTCLRRNSDSQLKYHMKQWFWHVQLWRRINVIRASVKCSGELSDSDSRLSWEAMQSTTKSS